VFRGSGFYKHYYSATEATQLLESAGLRVLRLNFPEAGGDPKEWEGRNSAYVVAEGT
jgi:hypothetical protein